MLQAIVKRGAPTVANDVLRWTRRMFDFAIKRHLVQYNPAAAVTLADAGGQAEARTRWLTREELARLFEAMRTAKGFSVENYLSVKLLILLAVRKQELVGARIDEFDLNNTVWSLPAERTETGAPIDIPQCKPAVEALRKLVELACSDDYLLPARKRQECMLPHIHENTLNVALSKMKPLLMGMERHAYFNERREAPAKWAAVVVACETPGSQGNRINLSEYAANLTEALRMQNRVVGTAMPPGNVRPIRLSGACS